MCRDVRFPPQALYGPGRCRLAEDRQGDVGGRPCRLLRRRARPARHRLARLVDPPGDDELRGAVGGEAVAAAACRWPVGLRLAGFERRRRGRVHPGRRRRPERLPPPLVRPLDEGASQRRGRRPGRCCTQRGGGLAVVPNLHAAKRAPQYVPACPEVVGRSGTGRPSAARFGTLHGVRRRTRAVTRRASRPRPGHGRRSSPIGDSGRPLSHGWRPDSGLRPREDLRPRGGQAGDPIDGDFRARHT